MNQNAESDLIIKFTIRFTRKDKMQADFPCMIHNDHELTSVCIESTCKEEKIFCGACQISHPSHKIIKFDEFREFYKSFEKVAKQNYDNITYTFKELIDICSFCIKKSQDRVLKEFCGNYKPQIFISSLEKIETQQLYGIASEILKNPVFEEMIKGKSSTSISLELQHFQQNLQTKVVQLQSEIMISINKFASESEYYLSDLIRREASNDFFFSTHLKHNWLKVQGDGKVLMRPTEEGRGLSVYGIVDKPLTEENNQIAFKILSQKQRFIYFGACCLENFQKNKYAGPVYEKGQGMYAIRQSIKPGNSAITLHNSIEDFSNKEVVGWDFQLGDKLKLQLNKTQNILIFSCNDHNYFKMPLDDCKGRQLYPFVGMKYEGEQIMILSRKQCQEKRLKQKQFMAIKSEIKAGNKSSLFNKLFS